MRFIIMLWIRKTSKLSVNNSGCVLMFAALFAISSLTAQAQDNNGFVVDEIIAKVDNYIVMKSDLDKAYQEYLANGASASQELKCQLLAMLIRNKLMMAK